MKKISKLLLLSLNVLFLTSCALPFQSSSYPTWKTKGVLEAYSLTDGRTVDGWMGAKIGQKITAKWYEFSVDKVESLSSYNGKEASNNKKFIHATITIKNTSDKDVYLFDEDFSLIWDLEKEERNHTSSIIPFADNDKNEMVIEKGQTKTIETVYEVDKNVKKPMAIYYYEQYSDGKSGNKYYVYID